MNEKQIKTRRTAGKILTWIGVLAWVPYLALTLSGKQVSIFPFLFFHLTGVIGGIKLRGRREKERLELDPRLRKISWILIYLGVLAWTPYIYQHNILGKEIAIAPYLTAHLSGILGGGLVRLSASIKARNLKNKELSPSVE